MHNLPLNEYPQSWNEYLTLAVEDTPVKALNNSWELLINEIMDAENTNENYAYAEGKWSLKQIIQHLIDTERIFAYRALRIARHDPRGLEGFDENEFNKIASITNRDWESMIGELSDLRSSTVLMFEGFTEIEMQRQGTANQQNVSVRAIAYCIAAHMLHHLKVIKERYFNQ